MGIERVENRNIHVSLPAPYGQTFREAVLPACLPCAAPWPSKEIDRLVYALYGLTEEEIGIVEGGKVGTWILAQFIVVACFYFIFSF